MVKNRTKQLSPRGTQPTAEASSVIVTFRISSRDFNRLGTQLNENPVVGVKSVHQLARKLLVDLIGGTKYVKLG